MDLSETKQIIYHLNGIDENNPKMYFLLYFLLNLSHYVKSYGHFCQILAFVMMPAHQCGHVTWPKKQISITFILSKLYI